MHLGKSNALENMFGGVHKLFAAMHTGEKKIDGYMTMYASSQNKDSRLKLLPLKITFI
jgi:hypothetical protein